MFSLHVIPPFLSVCLLFLIVQATRRHSSDSKRPLSLPDFRVKLPGVHRGVLLRTLGLLRTVFIMSVGFYQVVFL